MRLEELVSTSRRVGATRGRRAKLDLLADSLGRLAPDEIEIGVAFLAGELRQRRIGIGWATLRDLGRAGAAPQPVLTLAEVDAAFARIGALRGRGSAAERLRALEALLSRATREEQEFLRRLLVGEVRQGALEGLLIEAVARAAEVPAARVRRAQMLRGNLAEVTRTALTQGVAGLDAAGIELFRPLQPMLAQTAEDVAEALAKLGETALEFKLDGARVQVHREGREVRVFTRRGNEVTGAVPELIETARALPAARFILDGEAIALRPDGRPLPFQTTMRRFGRQLDVERVRRELPLRAFFFDCLHLEGDDLIDRPTAERLEALDYAIVPGLEVPRRITARPADAEAFLEAALRAGHEGVMAKSLQASWEAGRRGAGWLKVKPARTLDLVVLAAEWGSGRRRGWLSNLHLGARDPRTGSFVMLGKTFKGLTDERLAWQTRRFLELEIGREAHVVHVKPEQVVEIAFDGVQASPQYPGGLALRFARVRRYRTDKPASEADTIDTVRRLHTGSESD